MTIAQVRQWAHVVPLSILEKIEDVREQLTCSEIYKWIQVLLLTREEKIRRAIDHAHDIAQSGEISYQFEQKLGFVRLWVNTQKHGKYKLDLEHRSHFIGPDARFPEFEDKGRIKFTARNSKLRCSKDTDTSSYLEIEYTK